MWPLRCERLVLAMIANSSAPTVGLVDYRVQLASELLADIENDREGAERLLYKAARLADVAGDDAVKEWIECELKGYPDKIPPSVESWLDATGRRKRIHLQPAEVIARGLKTLAAGSGELDSNPVDVRINRESLTRLE